MQLTGSLCSNNVDDDGTRVIVYGGRLYGAANITAGDIYILNTVTRAWTAGKSGSPRIYTTCTIAGDQFLVWGGATTNNTIPPADIQIYSISYDNWITSYNPPSSYLNPSSTSVPSSQPFPSDSGSQETGSSSIGAIVGGVVGGLVIVLAALFLLYRRRQRARSGAMEEYANRDEDTKNQHNAKRPRERRGEDGDDNVEVLRSQLQTQKERHDALQQQVEFLQHQASTSSPSYDSLYTYQPPVVTNLPFSNPRIFKPSTASTTRIVREPTPTVSVSEWASFSSSSRPVVYDPSSSSPAPVSVVHSRKDPEFLSSELLQGDGIVEAPRSRHPHTLVPQSE